MSKQSSFKPWCVALLLTLAGAASAAEHVVTISGSVFTPAKIQIKAGDTVKWLNQEKRTSHSVLFPGTPALESERMLPDESWVRRFDAAGTYPYTCGPHPEMFGEIEVQP